MKCGILDQFSSVFGADHHALLIDCRSLTHEATPLGADAAFVVLDTKKERGLVDSEYNQRRAQCEEAVRLLAEALPGIQALRDVSADEFERHRQRLPDVVRRRAEHVIYENARVLQAAELCRAGDTEALGRLQNESQASLRDLYEVSCPELEAITRAARRHPACQGARLVGAGFGGCASATVDPAAADEFIAFTAVEYEAEVGYAPDIYATTAAQGVEVLG
jgi:galactokinase